MCPRAGATKNQTGEMTHQTEEGGSHRVGDNGGASGDPPPKEQGKVPPFPRLPDRQTWTDSPKMAAKWLRKGMDQKDRGLHKGTLEKDALEEAASQLGLSKGRV